MHDYPTKPISLTRLNMTDNIRSRCGSYSSIDDLSDILSGRFSISSADTDVSIPSYFESTSKCPEYTAPNDTLPSYTPTLESFGLCLIKPEFLTPYKSANKSWEPVLLELNLTQLIVYELQCSKDLKNLITSLFKVRNNGDWEITDSFFDRLQKTSGLKSLGKLHNLVKDNKMLFEPVHTRQEFLKVIHQYKCTESQRYTLNASRVGIAANMHEHPRDDPLTVIKYKNTLRLRVETLQALLLFWSFDSMVSWFSDLDAGKELSNNYRSQNMDGPKSLPNFTTYRNILALGIDDTISTDHHIDINGYPLYISNNYNTTDLSFIKACLPRLNSYDKWPKLVLSNFDQFECSNINNNLFLDYSKLTNKNPTNPNQLVKCRAFAIEQEGLVSVVGY